MSFDFFSFFFLVGWFCFFFCRIVFGSYSCLLSAVKHHFPKYHYYFMYLLICIKSIKVCLFSKAECQN